MKYRNYYCTPKYSDGEKMYYGDVQGAPEIPMIEAATLDDFERLFHQAVDDYLDRQGGTKPKTNWGLIITLVVIAAVIVAAIASCPKKDQHVAFLTDRINTIVTEELAESGGGGDLAPLGLMFGNAIVVPLVEKSLNVNDNFLFSVGKIPVDGKEKVVTVGAFGHIFSASKEQMKKALKDNKYMNDYLDLLK
jgi:hypothetical protein